MTSNKNLDIFNTIKEQTDIVNVIGQFLTLEKKGNNYWALCPFHKDDHASLSVSPKKQLFNCFSCNTKGDVFKFVKEYKSLSFLQAVQEVAEICNVDQSLIGQLKSSSQISEKYQKYYQINELALKFFKINLWNKKEQNAHNYLLSRNLSSELTDYFEIGYAATAKDGLINALTDLQTQQKITAAELKFIGLTKPDDDSNDFFNNRIIFPIRDHRGNLVAFSGRSINDVNQPKYLNTLTTPIFQKEMVLYNFFHVSNIDQINKLYICEGYMDVIALHRIGIKNAVALMGLNLSNYHINAIKNLKSLKEIILCLDNDQAGRSGMINVAKHLIANNLSVKLVNPYDDKIKDIDELVTKYPQQEVENILSNTSDYFGFLIKVWTHQNQDPNPNQVLTITNMVLEEIKKYADPLIQNSYVKNAAKQLNLDETELLDKFKKITFQHTPNESKDNIQEQPYIKLPINKDNFKEVDNKKITRSLKDTENQIFNDEINLIITFFFFKKAINDFENFSQFSFQNDFLKKLLIKIKVFYLDNDAMKWEDMDQMIDAIESKKPVNKDFYKDVLNKEIWKFQLHEPQNYEQKEMYRLLYSLMVNTNTLSFLRLTSQQEMQQDSTNLKQYKDYLRNYTETKKYIDRLFEKYNYHFLNESAKKR
ncbi:DNA primase [[Mycoplasma] testudinis]|uniref:DNA primase n=1 Tax=[Mycoplasma] testudinis TaxID=33924 RepID=UPI0006964A3A|nr:DNA primase [[Mycoplasma] testudinis]